jgi:hypothetical protein
MSAVACQPVAPYGQGNLLSPTGVLDSVHDAAASGPWEAHVVVEGWAAEWYGLPSIALHGPEPTQLAVAVNGDWGAACTVGERTHRPDVDAFFVANPIWDPSHAYLPYRRQEANYGFRIECDVDMAYLQHVADGTWAGEVTVCVVALNTMYPMAAPENGNCGGDHALLGCRTLTVTSHPDWLSVPCGQPWGHCT